MALYPKAIQKLIPPGPNDPRIIADGSVAHVAVSQADSLHDYFNGPSGGIESHFYIRYNGVVEQYRDTAFEADAQSSGNSYYANGKRMGKISYETEGMGSGQWTAEQIASIIALNKWLKKTHPQFSLVPAKVWNGPGIGYHAQFKEWNPNAHACPGPDRIKQFNSIVIPALNNRPKPGVVAVVNSLKASLAVARKFHRYVSAQKIQAEINRLDNLK